KPAVTVVIANCNAHSGECDAILIEGTAGRNRHFGESAVLVVVIEQAWRSIAGDVDIRPAIVVEVGRSYAHAVGAVRPPGVRNERRGARTVRIGNSGPLGDVLKGTVGSIPVQYIGTAG